VERGPSRVAENGVMGAEGMLYSGIEEVTHGTEEKSFNCAEGYRECSLLRDVEGGLLIAAEA
jgi:hypothetical protein